MLGADGLTFAAADAVNGLFGIREAGCPLLADGVLIADHPELVPDAEIVRNVHAHGAGHTVAAAGAADFDVAAQDIGSLPDGGVLGVGHGAEISEGGEVVVQLVFCAHAGEDDLHIFVAGYKTEVLPVTTAEYGLSKAARPFNSRLDKSKLVEAGFAPLPTWQDALSRYLKEIEQ